jgi:hypothetical protein
VDFTDAVNPYSTDNDNHSRAESKFPRKVIEAGRDLSRQNKVRTSFVDYQER